MSENTKHITIKGLYWNAIDRFGSQAVTMIIGVVLANLLDPENYTVIAAINIFTVIATSFVDSGLATSLVRSKEVGERDYSTIFTFNILVSISLYSLLFFLAPWIEKFQGIDNLSTYARVLFLQLIIHSFGIVQYVKVLKRFDFNIVAKANVISILCSGIFVCILAYYGYGIWALVLQMPIYSSIRTLLFWCWGDWKFHISFDFSIIKKHLSFSFMFMMANMLGKLMSPLYTFMMNKVVSPNESGQYYNGNRWGETPNMLISSIIQGTTLSTLAPIQDDQPRFLNACRKTMSSLAFALFPVSFLAICVADPAFKTFLGKEWIPSIPMFQWLCFSGIFIALTDMNVNFITIKGKSKFGLRLELVKLFLAVLVFYFTYPYGVFGIIYGQIAVRITCYLIACRMSKPVYGYQILAQLKDLFPSLLISLIAGVLAYLPLYYQFVSNKLLLIAIQTIIFAIIYLSINHLIKNAIWLEILSLLNKKFANKN
ncbi:lipopolysaccharide biosynthesis protein [Sphingobacterium sp. HJSM2_6]|uniref:lipopolysaccharide biosynthesis protein n=1 Tax=Sphingobacterium sp. HJSM2_6 TaxID=3366264 RepID=UPI003BD9EEA5